MGSGKQHDTMSIIDHSDINMSRNNGHLSQSATGMKLLEDLPIDPSFKPVGTQSALGTSTSKLILP